MTHFILFIHIPYLSTILTGTAVSRKTLTAFLLAAVLRATAEATDRALIGELGSAEFGSEL